MQQQLIDTIASQFYDGVLAPDAWDAALGGMCRQLQAGVFHFFTLDGTGAQVPDSAGNLEAFGLHDGLMSDYETNHAANDVRAATAMRLPMGQVMFDHEHIGQRALSRNSVYADWLVPLGLRHTTGSVVRAEGSALDFVSFMRPRDAKPYSPEDKTFLNQLMPHIMRAARLRARAVQLSREASLGLAALSSLPQGLAVVDAQCRIHYANPAAERLLAAPNALRAAQGRLHCTPGEPQARFQQLVAQACARPARAGGMDLGDGPQRLAVTVLPLQAHHALTAYRQEPMALVVAAVPGASTALDPRLVSDALALSPAETRLLLLLAAGKTVKDFAALEGCSWHTARTHLKNVMRKTGCHRQLELVQLVQALRVG